MYSGTNSIDTSGDNSHGIFAQSVGGGGGNGGYAVAGSIGDGVSVSVAVGGNAGAGGWRAMSWLTAAALLPLAAQALTAFLPRASAAAAAGRV